MGKDWPSCFRCHFLTGMKMCSDLAKLWISRTQIIKNYGKFTQLLQISEVWQRTAVHLCSAIFLIHSNTNLYLPVCKESFYYNYINSPSLKEDTCSTTYSIFCLNNFHILWKKLHVVSQNNFFFLLVVSSFRKQKCRGFFESQIDLSAVWFPPVINQRVACHCERGKWIQDIGKMENNSRKNKNTFWLT